MGVSPAEANTSATPCSVNNKLPLASVAVKALLIAGLKLAAALAAILPPGIVTLEAASSITPWYQSVPVELSLGTDIPAFANADALDITTVVPRPVVAPNNVSPVTSLAISILGSIACNKIFLNADTPPSSAPSPKNSPDPARNQSCTFLPVLAAQS